MDTAVPTGAVARRWPGAETAPGGLSWELNPLSHGRTHANSPLLSPHSFASIPVPNPLLSDHADALEWRQPPVPHFGGLLDPGGWC
jgi:hypothetical protein